MSSALLSHLALLIICNGIVLNVNDLSKACYFLAVLSLQITM